MPNCSTTFLPDTDTDTDTDILFICHLYPTTADDCAAAPPSVNDLSIHGSLMLFSLLSSCRNVDAISCDGTWVLVANV